MTKRTAESLLDQAYKKHSYKRLKEAYDNNLLHRFYRDSARTFQVLSEVFSTPTNWMGSGYSLAELEQAYRDLRLDTIFAEQSIQYTTVQQKVGTYHAGHIRDKVLSFMRNNIQKKKYDNFEKKIERLEPSIELTRFAQHIRWISELDNLDVNRPFAVSLSNVGVMLKWTLQNMNAAPATFLLEHKISFKLVDEIACSKGWWTEGSKVRAATAVERGLRDINDVKHMTCMKQEELKTYINDYLLSDFRKNIAIANELDTLLAQGEAMYATTGNQVFWASEHAYATEHTISQGICRLLRQSVMVVDPNTLKDSLKTAMFELRPSQLEAVRMVLANSIVVLTGPGGCGKTSAVLSVVHRYCQNTGQKTIYLAPTHMARRILSRDLDGAKVFTVAKAVYKRKDGCDLQKFIEQNQHFPVTVVVDEASMVGSSDMSAIFSAMRCHENCRLICAGDHAQLPPVVWGQPFQDMILSQMVPTIHLTEVLRTSDEHLLRFNKAMRDTALGEYEGEWRIQQFMGNTLTAHLVPQPVKKEVSEEDIQSLLDRELRRLRKGGVQADDIRVLTWSKEDAKLYGPIFRRILLGNDSPKPFVIGDNVIIHINCPPWVQNGDEGQICHQESENVFEVTIRLAKSEWPEDVASVHDPIKYDEETGELTISLGKSDMTLVHTTIVHKAQCQGFDHVVYVRRGRPSYTGVGKLNYTAYSRAKKTITIIGNYDYFNGQSARRPGDVRQTFLQAMLTSEDYSDNNVEIECNQITRFVIHKPIQNSVTRKRRAIPKMVRIAVWAACNGNSWGGKCYVCATELDCMHFECGHIVAHSRGGTDTADNLRPICGDCNKSMGTTNLEEYKTIFYKWTDIETPEE
jgi:ATP-dependent exoDNAse (exonuclease V) alpha subunit